VARNRQKAKERQARRKAKEQRGAGDGAPGHDGAPGADGGGANAAQPPRAMPEPAPEPPRAEPERAPEPPAPEPGEDRREDPLLDPYLEAGAPPEDVGRSDEVLDHQQDLEALDDEEDHYDPAEDIPEEDLAPGPKGRRADAEKHKDRPRFVQFLFAVWAELQRVQWPDRQALTTLTGVVLGFVLIAGGYLGLLDAIFSRIIQAIL
jgi:preprotein translocase SecE subunit